MAGIYIHIPFCRQSCHYCDFHFSTSMKTKDDVLSAMQKEMTGRKSEAEDAVIETIYFGGGTPSILQPDEIMRLLDTITENYIVSPGAEITLEANPDDLDLHKLSALRNTPVNRFSIGVQSFRDEDLKYMNRAHNAAQADYSIKAAQDKGFENITIDLIYGTPTMPDPAWKENLEKAIGLGVPHISSYALTVEHNTPLFHLIRRKLTTAVDEGQLAEQFHILMQYMEDAGFEQYEISNFSRSGFRSRHNSSYWEGKPYLGFGPSAHSFDGRGRRWNVAGNARYIQALAGNQRFWEEEVLSEKDFYNEYVMTNLRKMEGVSMPFISHRFGSDFLRYFSGELQQLSKEWITVEDDHVRLTREGKLLADRISSMLFFVD